MNRTRFDTVLFDLQGVSALRHSEDVAFTMVRSAGRQRLSEAGAAVVLGDFGGWMQR